MYSYIKGEVKEILPKNIVVDNNGIGYDLMVPNPYNFRLGEEIICYVYQNVREDAIELFGFKTKEQKDLFIKLISVKGIGPKSALSILAAGDVNDVIRAIDESNVSYLMKFPGIGQKASQQIILDLKGKLTFDEESSIGGLSDVSSALEALGYSRKEIGKVLPKLDKDKDTEALIRDALKLLLK